jgi:heme exporter protein B
MLSVLYYDLLLAWRRKSDWVNGWLFFLLVTSLFPLTITPDNDLLHVVAPGLIWVAALLSMLLALQQFLRPDYQDGCLNLLLLSPYPLPLLVLAKISAHWLMSGLPLLLMTPLLALLLHLSLHETAVLMIALLCGTPVFSLIGGIAAALTVALENSNFLLSLLVLPLCVPILIFGTGAVINVSLGQPVFGILILLSAFLVLALSLAPIAISAALRLA